jgi:hypothetical protein
VPLPAELRHGGGQGLARLHQQPEIARRIAGQPLRRRQIEPLGLEQSAGPGRLRRALDGDVCAKVALGRRPAALTEPGMCQILAVTKGEQIIPSPPGRPLGLLAFERLGKLNQ